MLRRQLEQSREAEKKPSPEASNRTKKRLSVRDDKLKTRRTLERSSESKEENENWKTIRRKNSRISSGWKKPSKNACRRDTKHSYSSESSDSEKEGCFKTRRRYDSENRNWEHISKNLNNWKLSFQGKEKNNAEDLLVKIDDCYLFTRVPDYLWLEGIARVFEGKAGIWFRNNYEDLNLGRSSRKFLRSIILDSWTRMTCEMNWIENYNLKKKALINSLIFSGTRHVACDIHHRWISSWIWFTKIWEGNTETIWESMTSILIMIIFTWVEYMRKKTD